jgi:hypothetical protein
MEKQPIERTLCQMWQDYLFLTKEMFRFLEEEDFDMFNELMIQREQLQKQLDKVRNQEFHHSQAGKPMMAEIAKINRDMAFKLRYYLNKAQQQKKVDNAYDGAFSCFVPSHVEWKS